MGKLILVIDDYESNQALIHDILTPLNYEVIAVDNGEAGVKIAGEKKPALILMDIQMPIMDGFTAVKILKNDPETKDIKIIGITSYAMKGDKEKIMEHGFDDYISKPLNIQDLRELVKKYIGNSV